MAAVIIGLSTRYVRTAKTRVNETAIVVAENYRDRNIGKELFQIEASLAFELGYRSTVNDCLGTQNPTIYVMNKYLYGAYYVIGNIPRCTVVEGGRWIEQVSRS